MKKSIITIICAIFFIMVGVTVNAASVSMSVSNSNPTVGDTITITISGADGVASISSSDSSVLSVGSISWIDREGTKVQAVAKKEGKATIILTPVDVVTPSKEQVVDAKKVTINVKAKSQPKPENPTDNSSSNSGSSSTSNKTPATNKPNTDKEKVKDVKEVEQKEEATPQFGMNSLILNGIKENGEKQEITFEPTFNIDTYEYFCNVSSDIKDIEVLTEAVEYNDYVKIEKPENLVDGENIIKITMSKDDINLTYTIKINKEAKIVDENIEEVNEKEIQAKADKNIITLSVTQFVVIIISICIIEGVLLKMPWKKLLKKKD